MKFNTFIQHYKLRLRVKYNLTHFYYGELTQFLAYHLVNFVHHGGAVAMQCYRRL